MVLDFNYLYDNPMILEYLRYHPKWYKILYYEPQRFKEFIYIAKKELHITNYDKLENIKKSINFINGFKKYMNKT